MDDARRTKVRELIASARSQAAGSGVHLDHGLPQGNEPVPLLLPGYEIKDEVFHGGQGVVYRARQQSTGRTVAVKIMRGGPFSGMSDRTRFEREVQVLGQLNHPNIVGIVDSGMASGSQYFVMEFVQGRPLDRWIVLPAEEDSQASPGAISHQNLKIAHRRILTVFATICDAVHTAHLRGIIHRDLKPNNILIDETGEPHILDFGLAKVNAPQDPSAEGLTLAGQFMGSLPWASPEQAADSNQVDIRTDIYSLGVMLYHALTHRFPYSVVGGIHDVLGNILHVQPDRPSSLHRSIDDELDTITLKCLAKDRARRYESAGELARDLRHYLADEPIEAKRDSAWYMFRKTVRRYRIPMAVAAMFFLLLAGSTIVMSVLSIRATRSGREAIQNLHASLVAQARATRRSGCSGQRFDALSALTQAAQIDPTLEVRNEAIAALAMPDVKLVRQIECSGSICFDPELARCAVSKSSGEVSIIRTEDGVETARIPPPTAGIVEIFRLALRGSLFVRLFDPPSGLRRLEIWTIGDTKPALELDDVPFRARFDLSPDGRSLAIGRNDHSIHIYDLESLREIQRIPLDRDPSYLTFDSTGRRLVLYHGNFESAKLLNLDTRELVPIFDSRGIAWSVAWQPNGSIVAGAAFNNVELWDAGQNKRIAMLAGHEDQVTHLAFSHDGNLLLSYSWSGQSVLWDIRTQRVLLRTPLGSPEFRQDDQQIAGLIGTISGTTINLLEFLKDSPRRCLISKGNAEATSYASGGFEPHSGLLFISNPVNGGAISRMYEPWSGRELICEALKDAYPTALDTEGRFILGGTDNGVFRWPLRIKPGHVDIGKPELIGNEVDVDTIQLSANGALALTGKYGIGEFRVREMGASGGAERLISCGRRVQRVRLSPDGRWVAIGVWYGSCVEVWDARTASRATTLQVRGNSYVDFSPDSKMLLTSDYDGITLRSVEDWRPLRHSPLTGVPFGFTPEGRCLVISSGLAILRLLESATLSEISSLESPESYATKAIAFTADGSHLAQFTNRVGVAHVWDLRSLRKELSKMGLDWSGPHGSVSAVGSRMSWRLTSVE